MTKIYLFLYLFTISLFTAQNTLNVKLNVTNFSGSGTPTHLTELQGNILFSGIRPRENGGNELWLYNTQTNRSSTVKNFKQGSDNYDNRIKSNIVKFNNKTYFVATENQDANNQLWESDGTTEGTKIVKHLYNSSYSNAVHKCFVMNNKLFIVTDYQLWSSDGTASGTIPLADINYNYKYYSFKGKVYYWQNFYDKDVLMVTDGSLEGTKVFKTFQRTNTSGAVNNGIITSQEYLYFVAKLNGVKSLWKTDGTEEGSQSIIPLELVTLKGEELDNKIVFYDESNKLWMSEGTAENTSAYKTLTSTVEGLFKYKNKIYVDTNQGFLKTDGTAENTFNHTFSADDDKLSYYTKSNEDNFLFLKSTVQYSSDVYIYDNTSPIKKLQYVRSYFLPDDFLEQGNNIYYSGYTDLSGNELYRFNTADKTETLVSDINFVFSSEPHAYLAVNDHLFYLATPSSQAGKQLFTRNIQSGETKRISNFTTSASSKRTEKVGDYYYAYDKFGTPGIYKSDGTAENTHLINPQGRIYDFFNFNDNSVIYITESNTHYTVYKLDNNSTVPIILVQRPVFSSGVYVSKTSHGAIINNTLYFSFFDENKHWSIWKTDGTPENTVKTIGFPYENLETLKILGTVNSKLIFYKSTNVEWGNYDIYSSDGTQANTEMIQSQTNRLSTYTENFEGKLYFLGTANPGMNLFSTDGTASGTKIVRSVGLGYFSTTSEYNLNNLLKKCGPNLFILNPDNKALWRSNGTTGGTYEISKNTTFDEMTCNKDYLYTTYFPEGGVPQILQSDGNRSNTKFFTPNIVGTNTETDEVHSLQKVAFKNIASDGTRIYFTGYGNKTDYHQYVVVDELPQYLSTNGDISSQSNIPIIYPNPSSDVINVKMTNNELIRKIEIIDATGKIVLTSLYEKNINIKKLTKSLYFVKIYTDSKIYTSKLLKK